MLVLPLVLILVLVPVLSAPVQTSFRNASEKAHVLVQKILQDLDLVYASVITIPGLTFDPADHSPNLQLIMSQIDLPPAPVLSPSLVVKSCVQRIWEGCELHERIVGVLATNVKGLSHLSNDLQDLKHQISQMGKLLGLTDSSVDQSQSSELAGRIHEDYYAQVATHKTLRQLRSFCQDVNRSLRFMSRLDPKDILELV